jgi:hypothetical protein
VTIKVVVLHWLAAVLIAGGTAFLATSTLAWPFVPPAFLGPTLFFALVSAIFVAAVPLRPVAKVGAVGSAAFGALACALILLAPGQLTIGAALEFGTATLLLIRAGTTPSSSSR